MPKLPLTQLGLKLPKCPLGDPACKSIIDEINTKHLVLDEDKLKEFIQLAICDFSINDCSISAKNLKSKPRVLINVITDNIIAQVKKWIKIE